MNSIQARLLNPAPWNPINELPDHLQIPVGDMPGDKVLMGQHHLQKANCLFPPLLPMLAAVAEKNEYEKAVISICGGSGVGKTEVASLIAYMLGQLGVGAYVLSGDNYPHRIPKYNDAERLNIFRMEGIRELIARGMYTDERRELLAGLQKSGKDSDPQNAENPWLSVYQQGGDRGLRGYLGTDKEINFPELSSIVSGFRNGTEKIFLKRMGREEGSAWYEQINFGKTNVLIIEWTHGNNDNLRGVDIPIFLYSTPKETLAHRKARARDNGVDSPFVTRVLNIEAKLLFSLAYKAKLIVSGTNELLTLDELHLIAKGRAIEKQCPENKTGGGQ